MIRSMRYGRAWADRGLGLGPSLGLAGAAISLLLAGCSFGPAPVTLNPGDFRSDEPSGPAGSDLVASDEGSPAFRYSTRDAIEAAPVSVIVGRPDLPVVTSVADAGAEASTDPRGLLTIDAFVGQINGEPVYASALLDQIGPRLREDLDRWSERSDLIEASVRADILLAAAGVPIDVPRMTAQARAGWWLETYASLDLGQRRSIAAADIIYRELLRRTVSQLVLAEARESLPQQVRQGLLVFLEQIRGTLIRETGGGSEAMAQKRLLERDTSLDELAQDQLDQEIIKLEIETKVTPRVQVPWKRVARQYARDFEQYNPESVATFRVVRVKVGDAPDIASVQARVDAGDPFIEIASSALNTRQRNQGSLDPVSFRGDLSGTTIFGPEALNEAAQGLSEGMTSAPVEFRGELWWIHLESIETPPGLALYEVQLAIFDALEAEKQSVEQSRYYERLLTEGSYSDLTIMTGRLLRLARERYFPADDSGAGG